MRVKNGKFRCDECKRVLDFNTDGGLDCGASHWFCDECLSKIEEYDAVVADRIERKHRVIVPFQYAPWTQMNPST